MPLVRAGMPSAEGAVTDQRPGMTPEGRRAAAWLIVFVLVVVLLVLLVAW